MSLAPSDAPWGNLGREVAGLTDLGFGHPGDLPASSLLRFPDGGAFRIEIPSVEGPDVLEAVLAEADRLDVPIHRISQGSGVMMLRDEEIVRMLDAGRAADVEVCLFLGPRASWDTGAGRAVTGAGPRARGFDQLSQSVADARRATALGLRCLLLADEGVLWALHRLRAEGELPADMRLKVSALTGPSNPASFRVLGALGADSINVPGDLSVSHLAELRAATGSVMDFYVESPDDAGGFIRHYEAAEMVRVAAPIYLKFGVRNAPPLYPSGRHLAETAASTARERVRRARLVLDQLERDGASGTMSPRGSWELAPAPRFALSAASEDTPVPIR